MSNPIPTVAGNPPAAAAAAGADGGAPSLGGNLVDAASALAKAPAAAASSSGPSGVPPSIQIFDLNSIRVPDLQIDESYWTKNMPKDVGKQLLKQSPAHAMATLVAHSDIDGRTLPTLLRELSVNTLKSLCKLLMVPVPEKGSHDVVGTCVTSILHAVGIHTDKFAHLVDKNARFPMSDAELSRNDASSSSEEDMEERKQTDHRSADSPRRSSRVVKSAAAAHVSIGSKSVSAKPGSSKQPATDAAAGLSSSVLGLIGALPSRPSKSDREAKDRSRGKDHSKHSKKSKGDKRKKSHRQLFSSSSSDDSDSDGPGRRGHGNSSDDSTSSSSSSDSNESSDDEHRDSFTSSTRHRRSDTESRMESNGLARPLAKRFIANALAAGDGHGSISEVYKDVEFKSTRNQRECQLLAKLIDAIRKRSLKKALELAVRRLVGVQSADASGNWKICDAFELVMDKQSFVPDEFLARAIKNVQRLDSLEGSSSRKPRPSKDSHSSRGGRGGGGGGAGRSGRGGSGGTGTRDRDRSSDTRAPRSSSNKDASKEARGGK